MIENHLNVYLVLKYQADNLIFKSKTTKQKGHQMTAGLHPYTNHLYLKFLSNVAIKYV